MFHHDPLLRHDSGDLEKIADDEIFAADSAVEWKARTLQSQTVAPTLQQTQPHFNASFSQISRFTAYAALQSISARVTELQLRNQLDYGSISFTELYKTLLAWYEAFQSNYDSGTDPLDLLILWHAIFLSLLTNFNKLERALGRCGNIISNEEDLQYAITWAKSISAERSILHAQAIQQSIGCSALNKDPAIHVPHCVFLAGLVSYSVMHFRRFSFPIPPVSRSPSEFPEFNLHRSFTDEHLVSKAEVLFLNRYKEQFMRTIEMPKTVHRVGADLVRQCNDILERVGHCGNARAYGKTLTTLIGPEVDKWMHG